MSMNDQVFIIGSLSMHFFISTFIKNEFSKRQRAKALIILKIIAKDLHNGNFMNRGLSKINSHLKHNDKHLFLT